MAKVVQLRTQKPSPTNAAVNTRELKRLIWNTKWVYNYAGLAKETGLSYNTIYNLAEGITSELRDTTIEKLAPTFGLRRPWVLASVGRVQGEIDITAYRARKRA